MLYWLVSSNLLMIMSSDECQRTLLLISQHRFRKWVGAVRQQAITWISVDQDPQRHMASLGPQWVKEDGNRLRDISAGKKVKKQTNNSWFFNLGPCGAYMSQWIGSTLFLIMACRLFGHYLNQCWHIINWTPRNKFSDILIDIKTFFLEFKMSSAKCWPCRRGLNVLIKGIQYVQWIL